MGYYTLEHWDNGEVSSQDVKGDPESFAKFILKTDGINTVEVYENKQFIGDTAPIMTFS